LEIAEQAIPHIEKAIGLKLFDEQKKYLLNKHYHINAAGELAEPSQTALN